MRPLCVLRIGSDSPLWPLVHAVLSLLTDLCFRCQVLVLSPCGISTYFNWPCSSVYNMIIAATHAHKFCLFLLSMSAYIQWIYANLLLYINISYYCISLWIFFLSVSIFPSECFIITLPFPSLHPSLLTLPISLSLSEELCILPTMAKPNVAAFSTSLSLILLILGMFSWHHLFICSPRLF